MTVTGNDSVYSVTAVDSGKGYVDGEIVNAYLVDGLNTPTIINAGINYSNNDTIVFSGGGYSSPAIGYVLTNSNGNITSVVMLYSGSGYQSAPDASVKSQYGSGGILSATVAGAGQFNTFSRVIGKVIRSGVGIKPGYWSTTKGFLNSNKYIQDSYFYQDFSYQIKVANTLEKYKQILYNTFHISGNELFGEFLLINTESSPIGILYDQNYMSLHPKIYLNSDMTGVKVDTILYTMDEIVENDLSSDNSTIKSDSILYTADQTYFNN